MITRDNYKELEAKALAADVTQEDIDNLGRWLERFGSDFWNGESYEIDAQHSLYAIYNEEVDDTEYDILGWEVR